MYFSDSFQTEIFLGDDHVLNYTNSPCIQCTGISSNTHHKPQIYKPVIIPTEVPTQAPTTIVSTTTIGTTILPDDEEEEGEDVVTDANELISQLVKKIRRSLKPEIDYVPPFDGSLDISSNYTGFVEVVGKYLIF